LKPIFASVAKNGMWVRIPKGVKMDDNLAALVRSGKKDLQNAVDKLKLVVNHSQNTRFLASIVDTLEQQIKIIDLNEKS
jgi:hypothetical protein